MVTLLRYTVSPPSRVTCVILLDFFHHDLSAFRSVGVEEHGGGSMWHDKVAHVMVARKLSEKDGKG